MQYTKPKAPNIIFFQIASRLKLSHYNIYLAAFYYEFNLQINPNYEPPLSETRTLFGLKMEQLRNNGKIDKNLFQNVKSKRTEVTKTILNY
jgi:hypothetical protein